MARAEHLPIYNGSYELCLYLEQTVHAFSGYHRITLGTDLRDGVRRKKQPSGPSRVLTRACRRVGGCYNSPR